MKVLNLFIILSCFFSSAFAQVEIKGTVIDSETKSPIPYVNIGIEKLAIGTVSDQNGVYQLKLKNKEGILTFSSIGYEILNIPIDQLMTETSIELIPKNYGLQEIEVVAREFDEEEYMLGVKNKTRGLSIGFGSRQLGTEIGALIPVKEPTFIKSANFVLNHAKGDSLLFRVNIYDYQQQQIGQKILKENIFIRAKQKRGVISVDLSSLNLILKNDVLLSLEWIKDDQEEGNANITFDTKKSKKLKGVYVKKTSIGIFETMGYIKPKLKPCFYFVGKKLK